MDAPGFPLHIQLLIMVAMPVALTSIFASLLYRRATRDLFRCLRCGHEFHRAVGRRFPAACPHCRARDWNFPA
jgi:hypothetical protein